MVKIEVKKKLGNEKEDVIGDGKKREIREGGEDGDKVEGGGIWKIEVEEKIVESIEERKEEIGEDERGIVVRNNERNDIVKGIVKSREDEIVNRRVKDKEIIRIELIKEN